MQLWFRSPNKPPKTRILSEGPGSGISVQAVWTSPTTLRGHLYAPLREVHVVEGHYLLPIQCVPFVKLILELGGLYDVVGPIVEVRN